MDEQETPAVASFAIAAVPGVTLTKWTRAWKDRRPDAPLEVIRSAPDTQLTAVLDGTADVAFVRLPAFHETLSIIPLYVELPVIVVPKAHPFAERESIELSDLVGENVLTGAWENSIALVAANVGVVIVPQSIARLHSRGDIVARPVTDAADTRIALAWLTTNTTERVEEFIGIVRGRTAHSSRTVLTPATSTPESKAAVRAKTGAKGGTQPIRPGQRSKQQTQSQARDAANRRRRGNAGR